MKTPNDMNGQVNITWQLSNDGLRPTSAPWGFVVRNPVTRAIPPLGKSVINTNITADYPMLAFPVKSHTDDLTVMQLIQPGREIVVTIENKSQYSTLIIEDKEPLINLHPLIAPSFTTEVK